MSEQKECAPVGPGTVCIKAPCPHWNPQTDECDFEKNYREWQRRKVSADQ